jgi:positive regulator of sigma E activity
MVRDRGVVAEIQDGMARVAMKPEDHTHCNSCGLCRRGPEGLSLLIDVPAPAGLKPGAEVVVEIPGPDPARSAVIILLIPLAFLIAGIGLGEWLRNRGTLSGGSGVSALLGLGLMMLSYLGAWTYDRHLRHAPHLQPRIVEWPGQSEN